jgi:anti-sigma regulatory factor (Ser/Thr protein kinase)
MRAASRRVVELTLPGTELSVRLARQCAGLVLRRLNHSPDVVEEAETLVAELAANAVRHSASGRPGGTFTLEVTAAARDARALLTVAVHDQGSDDGCPVVRPISDTADGGRGLVLVDALAHRWGFGQSGARSARVVWAELASSGDVVPDLAGSGAGAR